MKRTPRIAPTLGHPPCMDANDRLAAQMTYMALAATLSISVSPQLNACQLRPRRCATLKTSKSVLVFAGSFGDIERAGTPAKTDSGALVARSKKVTESRSPSPAAPNVIEVCLFADGQRRSRTKPSLMLNDSTVRYIQSDIFKRMDRYRNRIKNRK